jgi:lipid-A-disaccharide synthase
VVAGEHSGDAHAAQWVGRLLKADPSLRVYTFGGPALKEAGAALLLDTTPFSVVGLWEVLRHYRALRSLFNQVFSWIKSRRPRCVCLVDFPGFNLPLAKKLYAQKISVKGGGNVKIYYYIAPQVWAWKSRRRFAMERHLDALGVIFPFEVECFKDTRLPVAWVGHPLLDRPLPFRYQNDGPLLLLPGSRRIAVEQIFPRLCKIFECLHDWYRADEALVVYPDESIRNILQKGVKKFPRCGKYMKFVPYDDRISLAVSGAIMSSGTASLSVALAGIPGIIVYRVNPFTYWMGRLLVKTKFLGMANLLLDRSVYPEFIQDKVMPVEMADTVAEMLDWPEKFCETFQKHARELHRRLSSGPVLPPENWIREGLR